MVRIFDILFPETQIAVSPWSAVFWQKDRAKFHKTVGVFAILCALAYVLHYHFVDLPQDKQPSSLWFGYRYGAAAWSLLIFFAYKKNLFRTFMRTPYFLSCLTLCYFQGQTLIWHPGTPYQYGFVIAFIMAWSLQTSMLKSMLAFACFLGIQMPAMFQAEVPTPHLVSNTILFAVSLIFTRLSYKLEIESFLNDMELTAQQQKNIEQSIEFSNHLLAFLPRMIGLRLKSLMARESMPIAAAADVVLKPRTVPVACIYSDIRGFTKKSKNLEFVSKTALNEIQALSLVVDESQGIPRKIGDLMFAYFDSSDLVENVVKSAICAIRMYQKNKELNSFGLETNAIERRFILTSGLGVVGNLGTSLSSIEITAMGPSVNLAARIDEMTKDQKVTSAIKEGQVICSNDFGAFLKSCVREAKIYSLELSELSVAIRDFKDESRIWFLDASLENLEILESHLFQLSKENVLRRSVENLEAS